MVEKNDVLMRELEDEIRADRYRKLWDRYRIAIIAAVLAIPLGTGLYQFSVWQTTATAQAAGTRFEAARQLLADQKEAEARKAFAAMAEDAPDGYALLARFHNASALVKDGKTAEAIVAYSAIADDHKGPMADLARLQAASLELPTASWTAIQARLTPLTDERNAFRTIARELLGVAATKAGKPEDARRAFIQVLSDERASPAQKDRVNAHMAGIVAADLAGSAIAPPAPTPTPAASK